VVVVVALLGGAKIFMDGTYRKQALNVQATIVENREATNNQLIVSNEQSQKESVSNYLELLNFEI